MRFSHITFSLRCQYCISKIHFIHVAPSSYSYFKDRVDYLSETIVEELLFCHTILRAKEFSPHEIHGTPRKWSTQILAFCIESKSKKELASFCGFKDLRNFTLKHINPFGYKKTPENLDFPGFVNIIRLSLSR